MDWLTIVKLTGMFATVVFLYFLFKELRNNMKESNNGRVSDRCELD